ncbi:hypothetical protein M426DRAFT_22491 [Hypoxylon sp. CI-4A]|nr:hypothetical protein M426DRAFT_22491 [Hypoxylon sp. CI-4A]
MANNNGTRGSHHGRMAHDHNQPESGENGPGTNVKPRSAIDQDEYDLRRMLVRHFQEDIFEVFENQGLLSFSRIIRHLFGIKQEYDEEARRPERQVVVRLSLAALNRMRMRRLQIKLAEKITRMHYYEEWPDDWEGLLDQYISATRDNDYISTCVDRGLNDPFLIRSERFVDSGVINGVLSDIPYERREKLLRRRDARGRPNFNLAPPLEESPEAIGGTRTENMRRLRTKAFYTRILASVVVGAFIVGPMWLMILVNTQFASLISASVFVCVGGVIAAWTLDSLMSVVSVTAAYAAILVVFVGANNATS